MTVRPVATKLRSAATFRQPQSLRPIPRGSTRRLGGLLQTLDDKHIREQSRQTPDSLQIRFPTLTESIEKLSGGQRQAVAIARGLFGRAAHDHGRADQQSGRA
jgi:ABC-type dipeptide/oligopeptide/nickel transport system ATPase subunit